MTVGSRSYGTVAQVEALTKRFTASGVYTATTTPSLDAVETWIDQVSATLNVALAGAGFAIPLAHVDAKAACAAIVTEAVADLCRAANSSGRFFTDRALERGVSPIRAIRNEMSAWVEEQADGLELLGATRTRAYTAGILTRSTDEGGDPTSPMFQRGAFGNVITDTDV